MTTNIDLTTINKKILSTRRQYGDSELLEHGMSSDPFIQFISWFEDALNTISVDPCAMVLSTVDEANYPDSRVVLLLGLKYNKFIFYTSYEGVKASQIAANNKAAINFYWPPLSRQIRIQGHVTKISKAESQLYFSTRDRGGQIASHGAIQSSRLKDRESMVQLHQELEQKFKEGDIPCPEGWGGYELTAVKYEFFQGRNSRLHDRISYTLNQDKWERYRLVP
jgi:pyridoxamine 5'-phosphate oxidase